MAEEIKYTHRELSRAVERIEDLGDFNTQVDASRKAGEILNAALDQLERGVVDGVFELGSEELEPSQFDNSDFKLG